LVAAIAWATVGSLVGALVLYLLGALWGRERVCATAERVPLLSARDVERAVDWFERHGRSAIFLGRLVPGVRSFISIPAGVERMPLLEFSVFTTAGSLVWNSALILAGYELGSQWHRVESYVGDITSAIYAAIGIAVLYYVLRRVRRRSTKSPARRVGHD
jgi:membrane protein DedA with SNARE-associated domain